MNEHLIAIFSVLIFTFLFCWLCYAVFKKANIIQLETSHKHPYLDALRGLAAFMVVLSHSSYIYNYWTKGFWRSPFEGFAQNLMQGLGTAAVPVFFMLTSFLFFEKHLFSHKPLNTQDFYKKRFFRLVPMYLFSVVLIFIAYAIFYNGQNLDFPQILKSVLSWLSFGYFKGITLNPGIGGNLINGGVFWTLIIEWKFYLFFPAILALLTTFRRTIIYLGLFFAIFTALYYVDLMPQNEVSYINYFAIGLISVLIYKFKNEQLDNLLKSKIMAMISLLLLGYYIYFEQNGYAFKMNPIHGLFFILASNGNSFLGLLKSKTLAFMGTISYSVYLIHGVILSLIQYKVLREYEFDFTTLTCVSIVVIVLISTLTYKYIELPFLTKNKKEEK